MSTRAYVPARKSSVTSRASGRTSANVGRSPNPRSGPRSGPGRGASRRALAADGHDGQVARVLGDLAGGEPDRVRVEGPGEAAIGRDQHDQPLAAFALGEERVVVAAEDRGQVGEDLVDLLAVGPRREGRVLGALQLGRGHELHRPRDLLDVLRRRRCAAGSHAGLPRRPAPSLAPRSGRPGGAGSARRARRSAAAFGGSRVRRGDRPWAERLSDAGDRAGMVAGWRLRRSRGFGAGLRT